jgi:uncharacterized membrane protein YiaA
MKKLEDKMFMVACLLLGVGIMNIFADEYDRALILISLALFVAILGNEGKFKPKP